MGKKDLSVLVPEKQDAFTRIVRWYSKSDITLLANEEAILNRWIYCDALMREGSKAYEEMVADVEEKFGVSKFTARKDIDSAMQLFARVRNISKKYLLHIHAENINHDLQKIRKRLFTYTDKKTGKTEEQIPDDKNIGALAKLNDSYTKAIVALPDEQNEDPLPPPKFIFQLAPGQTIEVGMSYDDAAKLADEIVDLQENAEGVYTTEDEPEQ
jgi:molybdopterin converting factor small subunit